MVGTECGVAAGHCLRRVPPQTKMSTGMSLHYQPCSLPHPLGLAEYTMTGATCQARQCLFSAAQALLYHTWTHGTGTIISHVIKMGNGDLERQSYLPKLP